MQTKKTFMQILLQKNRDLVYENETLKRRIGELSESYQGQIKSLKSVIDEANAQQSPAEQVDGFPFVPWSKEKEFLESMQQSPAVAVPDSDDGLLPIDANDHPDCRVMYWSEQELRAIKDYARRCIAAQSPSPRITEQDAREIGLSAYRYWMNNCDRTIDNWVEDEGHVLLAKINAK